MFVNDLLVNVTSCVHHLAWLPPTSSIPTPLYCTYIIIVTSNK